MRTDADGRSRGPCGRTAVRRTARWRAAGQSVTPSGDRCAAQLSFWLPGLGQLYLRRWVTGSALLFASWITFDQAWRGCSATWTVAAVAVWIVAVRDAGRGLTDPD
jgi:hypothetical protein